MIERSELPLEEAQESEAEDVVERRVIKRKVAMDKAITLTSFNNGN